MHIHCFLLVPLPSWNQNTMRRLHFPLFLPQKYLMGLIKMSVEIYTFHIYKKLGEKEKLLPKTKYRKLLLCSPSIQILQKLCKICIYWRTRKHRRVLRSEFIHLLSSGLQTELLFQRWLEKFMPFPPGKAP